MIATTTPGTPSPVLALKATPKGSISGSALMTTTPEVRVIGGR